MSGGLFEVGFKDYLISVGLLDLWPKACVLHPGLIIYLHLAMELVSLNASGQEEFSGRRWQAIMENDVLRCFANAK
jgi:hypothetical protein